MSGNSQRQYDNNLKGVLFKNDKQGNEKRPDYRGQCEINRVQYWVSAWVNESRDGKKFMSLNFEAKTSEQYTGGRNNPEPRREARRGEQRSQRDFDDRPQRRADPADFDDDIPF